MLCSLVKDLHFIFNDGLVCIGCAVCPEKYMNHTQPLCRRKPKCYLRLLVDKLQDTSCAFSSNHPNGQVNVCLCMCAQVKCVCFCVCAQSNRLLVCENQSRWQRNRMTRWQDHVECMCMCFVRICGCAGLPTQLITFYISLQHLWIADIYFILYIALALFTKMDKLN